MRAAVAADTERILAEGRARIQQQQARRDLEKHELMAHNCQAAFRAGLMGFIVAAATVASTVFAINHVGGAPERILDQPVLVGLFAELDETAAEDAIAATPADANTNDAAATEYAAPTRPATAAAAPPARIAPTHVVETSASVLVCGDSNDPLNPRL